MNLIRDFVLRFPLHCSELRAALQWECIRSSAYLGNYGAKCSLRASLQLCGARTTTATAPAFYAGFEAKQNVSVAEDGVRMFVRRD